MRTSRLLGSGSIVALLVVTTSVARAEEAPASSTEAPASSSESRPAVLNETAGVASAMHGWAHASGGAIGGGRLALDGAAMASPFRRLAVAAGVSTSSLATSPWAGAYVQFLEQSSAGIDMTTSFRWRGVGPEDTGQQIMGRLAIGRAFGPAYLSLNGGVGQGIGGARRDVDYEAGGVFYVRVARIVRLGAEGRVRGEAQETFVTEEDAGRPIDVLGGAIAGLDFERFLFQALAGWSSPRGLTAPGPAVLGAATLAF